MEREQETRKGGNGVPCYFSVDYSEVWAWDQSRSSSCERILVEVGRHDSEHCTWHWKRKDISSTKPGDPKVNIGTNFHYAARGGHVTSEGGGIRFSLQRLAWGTPLGILSILFKSWVYYKVVEKANIWESLAVLIDFLLMFTHHHRSPWPISQY